MNDSGKPIAVCAETVEPRGKAQPFAAQMAGRQQRMLGDLFGLSRFGVSLTTLQPGACSALRHVRRVQGR